MDKKTVLVSGGAGYIGSHTAVELIAAGVVGRNKEGGDGQKVILFKICESFCRKRMSADYGIVPVVTYQLVQILCIYLIEAVYR